MVSLHARDYAHLDKINVAVIHHEEALKRVLSPLLMTLHGVGALGKTGRGTEEYTPE